MLLKLFKYDFKNTKRYCLPLLIALAAGTVIACFCFPAFVTMIEVGLQSEGAENVASAVMILSVFGFFAAIFIIIVSVALFQIMVCVEFYRSLVTDEGYLTFTLPVKSSTIIKSKMLNGLTWGGISYGALFVSILSIVITAVVSVGIFADGGGGGDTGGADSSLVMGAEDVILIILAIIYAIISYVSGFMLYFTAIFFGSVVTKKNKLIAAIACIFGANFAYGMLTSLSSFGLELIMMSSAPELVGSTYFMIFILVMMIVYSLGMIILMYYLLKYMMENKLNLA